MSAITFIRMFAGFDGPLLTCEAVLTEACHLLRTTPNGHDRILEMVQVGGLIVHPMLPTETTAIRGLLSHYKDQGMDFADACIVRLSELHNNCHVITADVQDFRVYRRNGRLTIPLISPHPEFSRTKYSLLSAATPEDLAKVTLRLQGRALRWESLDEDIWVDDAVAGRFPRPSQSIAV